MIQEQVWPSATPLNRSAPNHPSRSRCSPTRTGTLSPVRAAFQQREAGAQRRQTASLAGRLVNGLLAAGIAGLMTGCGETPPAVAELAGETMGTTYSIKVSPPPDTAAGNRLQQQIEHRLEAINRQMSTYLPDSDLSRFNESPSVAWQIVPPALAEITDRALAVSRNSNGAYDITIGPLVDLWGFGSDGRRETPPSDAQIVERLGAVGFERLAVRQRPPALRKSVAGLRIDLSSIAKGWAVDRIGDLLSANGYDNFLVEIGGEILARGKKAPDSPWTVAVERPAVGQRQVHRVITLRDMAMATSGDYRNFFESDGQRYSHTIDPHSGQARGHALASVTVIAERCTDADAWATALMAAGDVDATVLADRHALKALLLVRDGDGFREWQSRELQASTLLEDNR